MSHKANHPSIQLNPIKSSQIKAIGHDASTNTLAVEFNSGGIYHYSGFDADKFKALSEADSIGSHFYKHIKGKYDYVRINPRKEAEAAE